MVFEKNVLAVLLLFLVAMVVFGEADPIVVPDRFPTPPSTDEASEGETILYLPKQSSLHAYFLHANWLCIFVPGNVMYSQILHKFIKIYSNFNKSTKQLKLIKFNRTINHDIKFSKNMK